jgi:hypothetical protein
VCMRVSMCVCVCVCECVCVYVCDQSWGEDEEVTSVEKYCNTITVIL